jgi:hypothetical protein
MGPGRCATLGRPWSPRRGGHGPEALVSAQKQCGIPLAYASVMKSLLPPFLVVVAALAGASAVGLACGGAVDGGGADGPGASSRGAGGSPDAAAQNGDSPSGSTTVGSTPGQTTTGVSCTTLGSGGTAGTACEVKASQSCSDGNTYSIECSCGSATCYCFETGQSSGSSSGGISFSCPSGADCAAYGYAACGFPSTVDAGSTVGQPVLPVSTCPGIGNCPAGTYGTWFGGGGNGGGGCAILPTDCASDNTCGCLIEAGVSTGCPCTDGDAGADFCCN